jgi:hypothetical protein
MNSNKMTAINATAVIGNVVMNLLKILCIACFENYFKPKKERI